MCRRNGIKSSSQVENSSTFDNIRPISSIWDAFILQIISVKVSCGRSERLNHIRAHSSNTVLFTLADD